jgi:hypothetical protein
MALIGYARCSTVQQDMAAQLDALASPESEAPASGSLGVSAEALLQRLPANVAGVMVFVINVFQDDNRADTASLQLVVPIMLDLGLSDNHPAC